MDFDNTMQNAEHRREEERREGDDSSSSASFYTAPEFGGSECERSISPTDGGFEPSSTSSSLPPLPPSPPPLTPTRAHQRMASSNSASSWTSSQTDKKNKLERLQNNAGHIGVLKSPFFPKNLSEFLDHEIDMNRARVAEMELKTEQKKETRGIKADINVDHSTEGEVLFKNTSPSATNTAQSKAKEKKVAKKGFSTLLEETTIWKPEYTDLPEKRDPNGTSIVTRAAWPDQNELKAEGEYRLMAFGERRLPLPRKDMYSPDAVRAKVGAGATCKELAQHTGEEIAWYERETIEYTGLDKLESIDKEKESPYKTWTARGSVTPIKPPRNASGRSTPSQHSPGRGSMRGGTQTAENQVYIPGFGTFAGGGFQGMADPQYNDMMGGLWNQFGTQMTAQGLTPPPGMASPTPGFAASANRAVSGSSSRGGKPGGRHGKKSPKTPKSVTSSPVPAPSPPTQSSSPQPDYNTADDKTPENGDPEKKSTGKKKKKKGKGAVRKDEPFSEFDDEEEFLREKGFDWVLDN
ncbi:hypothetical protein HYFRA_00001682 [Hymenoscyphus fraxineus]|uniref:Uncharacterized protein n=1 Tax=Hymenoscyphus fraxineus TaxID=746836 RepID=A0A9N9L8R3_9HELO|nr:hypothetical protein HYFRA_00001682 [Hymenoscyphus fraxineus]